MISLLTSSCNIWQVMYLSLCEVCGCLSVLIHIYICLYMCMYMHVCAYMQVCKYMCMCAYMCMCVYVCITYMDVYVYTICTYCYTVFPLKGGTMAFHFTVLQHC